MANQSGYVYTIQAPKTTAQMEYHNQDPINAHFMLILVPSNPSFLAARHSIAGYLSFLLSRKQKTL